MEQELCLTDLIDRDTLQMIQDAFSAMTGMAALTTDSNGVPITEGSHFTEFCMKYVRNSKEGRARCEQCDKYGGEVTLEKGEPISYFCHAGLIDYAAPILADGRMVGSFIGGQVLTEPAKKEQVYKVAEDLDIDPEVLWEKAQEVRILNPLVIKNAAQFLYTVAKVLSDMAYGKYMALQANEEIERANNMKSDFLANMSHEIRTPMNAVIGMAEMALREELSPKVRDYIRQIRSSSRALLTIINDILDFSKIESGKLDIVPVVYEPMSIINDIANIAMERLREKDEVELILDVSPDIPNKLFGDNIRIQQILLNIVNNAAKFTNKGQVALHVGQEVISEKQILLKFSVEDTGIGIREKDLEKIFDSFQQLDSKRNRNIEGTGLGLAISRSLTRQMGGNIQVRSEYGKGSVFSFELPQKVVEMRPNSKVKEPEKVKAFGMFGNEYVKRQFEIDCERLGVEYQEVSSVEEIKLEDEKEAFLFVEQEKFTFEVEEYIKFIPELNGVLLLPFHTDASYDIPNLLLIKKPLFTMSEAMIFNKDNIRFSTEEPDTVDINFVAPTAEVLVVDDNAVNLTVAVGLLEPLQVKVETAISGKEAVEKISAHHYDLILMDHMMPEIDGIEATHIIRRFHPEYNDVPIIALTANAVSGTKEMFLREGMNDFVPKPIELKTLLAKVGQWLPVEKVKKVDKALMAEQAEEELVIGDLDTKSAIKLLGGMKLFRSVLKDYYRVIEKKSDLIKEYEEKEDWAAYTIEVHALKSASRQIGAMPLSEKAAALEKAGNARDSKLIHEKTDELLAEYRAYLPVLAPFCEEEKREGEGGEIAQKLQAELFEAMRAAVQDLDMDQMEAVIKEMDRYSYQDKEEELFLRLKEAVENVDVDTCEEILDEWEIILISEINFR